MNEKYVKYAPEINLLDPESAAKVIEEDRERIIQVIQKSLRSKRKFKMINYLRNKLKKFIINTVVEDINKNGGKIENLKYSGKIKSNYKNNNTDNNLSNPFWNNLGYALYGMILTLVSIYFMK